MTAVAGATGIRTQNGRGVEPLCIQRWDGYAWDGIRYAVYRDGALVPEPPRPVQAVA